ncbi:unnamed protein product, partial [Staurois parvus]
MGIKNHRITLQGCLLVWIGISLVLVKDTTESDTTADPTMEPSVTPMDATTNTTIGQPMEYIERSVPTDNSSMNVSNGFPTILPQGFPTILPQNSCHLFYCMGDSCYKNETSFLNSANTTCSSYCEMYRHNSSFYESRCNQHCMHHICNSTQQDGCALNCCNQSMCLTSEDMMGGNMTMYNQTAKTPVTATTTTTTTATTTTTIQYSDKKCRSFTCSGTDCYKNQAGAATKQCQVGKVHCELQKKVTNGEVSYEGG